jgi:uncharacterized repeat protein (TIGR01451 family)
MRLSKFLAVLAFLALQLPLTALAQFPPTPAVKMAVNPLTNKVYVANESANTVTAFNIGAGTSVTIPVGARPFFIAVNPATNKVYVNNSTDATLSVIDGSTDTFLATYPIGSTGPITVNPVTNTIYIVRLSGLGTDEVTFFNGATNDWYTIATESFQPNALAVNPVTNKIYVAHYGTGDVRVIDGTFNHVDHPATASIAAWSHPFAIAANPVTNKVYAITEDSRGPILVINGADNSAFNPAITPGHATGPQAIAVNPVTNKIYAAFAGEVIVIDGATNALTYLAIPNSGSGTIALGIDYATNKVYVATALGSLSVIDGATNAIAAPEAIATGTSVIGVNPVTNTVFFFDTALTNRAGTAGSASIPLTTTITPFAGDTITATTTVTLNAASGFSPNALPVRGVYFRLDDIAGSWTAASGSGPFTASLSGLSNGSHTLYAFAADGQDAPLATGQQSSPLVGAMASYTFTVAAAKVDPNVSLGSSGSPSLAGESVVFTSSVTGSAGTATGTVTFRDGSTPLCAPVTLSGGTASCGTTSLGVGPHSITAQYSGDTHYNARTSDIVTQTVTTPKVTPTVTVSAPADHSIAGQQVTFTAAVTGGPGVATGNATFRDGATTLCNAVVLFDGSATCSTSSLAIGSHSITAQYSGDASYNGTTSAPFAFTVTAPPVMADLSISQSPSANPAHVGEDLVLTLTAANNGPDAATGVAISDTLSPSLTFISASAGCSHTTGTVTCGPGTLASGTSVQFSVVVRPTAAGSVTSIVSISGVENDPNTANNNGSMTLTVDEVIPARVGNLSTRGRVGTANDVMIAGFIVGGSSAKTVVINVAGPSLANYGVQGSLANPTLTLVRASDNTIVATNDDWQTQAHAGDAAAIQGTGFQPNNPLEPALIATLPPGAYTAIVSGVGNTTGVGLVGVFEVDHPEVPLVNISTRGSVLTDNDVMIAGIIVQGTGTKRVVINVAGPSLANYGITNPLANPMLTVVRASDNTTIATNDDWQTQTNPADVAAIQATGFQPNHPQEPAVIANLPPGAYTVIVQGVNGGTGVGLVGVFAAP